MKRIVVEIGCNAPDARAAADVSATVRHSALSEAAVLIELSIVKTLPTIVVARPDGRDDRQLGEAFGERERCGLVEEAPSQANVLRFAFVTLTNGHRRSINMDLADQRSAVDLGNVGRMLGETQPEKSREAIRRGDELQEDFLTRRGVKPLGLEAQRFWICGFATNLASPNVP
jgi:hypothetical protein